MSSKLSQTNPLFNPFPGLRPFTQDESHLFFGREGQSRSVLSSLESNNFVAVIGASGSGKSSLIYCGVIPALRAGSEEKWAAVSARPGTSPIRNLVEAIADKYEGKVAEDDYRQLIDGSVSIHKWIRGILPGGKRLLLIIDQFEEIFRYRSTRATDHEQEEVDRFVELIYSACTDGSNIVNVVLTMRSDFIGECSVYQNLTALINRSNYLIPQMTRDDFRKAIEGPVGVGGATIETSLVEQLLDEVGENTDQLPVLQHSLMRTWDYWMMQNDPEKAISAGDYEAIGRMEKALSDHANEAYEELDESQRIICENLFKTITEKGGDNRGVRRPSSVRRIAEITRSSAGEIIRIADVFRSGGRTFLTPYQPVELNEDSIIDISHESLMRIWDRLRLWVDEEASSVHMYKRLSEAAALYQAGTVGLWRPPDLQLALNWREKQEPTITWAVQYNPAFERAMVFLDTSALEFRKEEENKIRLQRRRLKVTRMFSLVLGGIAVIAMGLFLWTRDLQNQAEARRIEAEEQRVLAEQSAEEAKRQEEAALAARDIADVERERAVMASNLAEERRMEAEAATELAKRRQLQADRSAEEARKAQALAQSNADTATMQRIRAEQASEEALKRRMLSVAQSMAVKSEQMRIDTLLKGLLAYQSYSFNKQYEGISYDPDIFKSSYNGIKFFKGHDYNVYDGHSSIVRTMVPYEGKIISGGSDGQVISWDFGNNSSKVLISDLPIVKRVMVTDQSLLCLTSNSIINYHLSDEQFANFDLAGYGMKDMFVTGEGKFVLVYDDRIVLTDNYKNAGDELYITDVKINAVKFDQTSGYLFAALSDGRILYWKDLSAEDSELLLASVSDGNWGEISFNYQKNVVAAGTGNNQGAIYLWNINTGKQINSLRGHNAKITGISFSSDGSQMASASYDGSVCLWNMDDLNTLPVVFDEHGTWVTSVGFSPDDRYVISGDKDGNLRTLPTKVTSVIDEYCSFLTRDLTELEWQNYVGEDIPYNPTKCINRQ
jgi:WD40 repeat protein/energy-coupling factor transporter ATP-binding protein EcfA2